jgi:hypothetical protein
MSLRPLIDVAESRNAFSRLLKNLSANCKQVEISLGWQGGRARLKVHWNPELRFWSCLSPDRFKTNYWCCFGTRNPTKHKSGGIICEVNSPKQGFDRRLAGIFLRDDSGETYLAHSGKVGGGRKGIGKSNFLKYYQGPLESVLCPNGKVREYIVIGPVNGNRLPLQVAHFVDEVKRFKSGTKNSKGRLPQSSLLTSFTPEFSGQRKSYQTKGDIVAECDHGPVISALAKELEARNLRYGNDRLRDLFVVSNGGKMKILFEAKTDLGTSSIYSAVGQLMLHGAAGITAPNRVLVVPGTPKSKTHAALKKLGIVVLAYEWTRKGARFPKLSQVLR